MHNRSSGLSRLVCIALLSIQLLTIMASCGSTATSTPAPTVAPTVQQGAETASLPADAPTDVPVEPTAERTPLATPTLAVRSPKSMDDLQRIEPEELQALMESGADIIVVDNQPAESYEQEHIAGAVSFPWAAQIPSPKDLSKKTLLVLYCGCAAEEDSADVAMQLVKRGYSKLMLLNGGWLRWVELGYPTEKGGE